MKYDVAVIGGGPAGYIAAIRAAQLGGKVILFEKDTLGGTCLNRGCIPTKTYIKTAEEMEVIRNASKRGILNDAAAAVDMPKVVAYKDKVVKQLTTGVGGLLKSNDVTVVYGEAQMATEATILCDGKTYEAASTILCGGSKASVIPIPGVESKNVLLSTEMLQLDVLPKSLIVIGGGVIGCEMAVAFNSFGSKVTIIEALDRIAATMDGEVSDAMLKSLKKSGIDIHVSQKVERIEDLSDGQVAVHFGDGKSVTGDKVLLSIGRVCELECLGSLKDSIRTERGKVVVDDHMRTSIPNIYAAGDINGKLMLAHTAFEMGKVAAENAMGKNAVCNLNVVPSIIYTIPEASSVGITEEEAKKRYGADNIAIGKFPFAANGRALASGATEGFVKVIVEKKYHELLGVHIFGASAAEMIAEAASLMASEVPADIAANIIHPHPSVSEAFMEACADAMGECMHLPKRK